MRELKQGNSVLYGFPTPPLMEDIVNLVLTYDKIYDHDEMLKPLTTEAKALARHFSGEKLSFEDVKGWDFPEIFVMIFSISAYHGFDIRNILDSPSWERILWLQEAKSTRKADCERFIKIIDNNFQLVSKNAPAVAEKVISTLASLHILFDESIVIPIESLSPELDKAHKATVDILMEAISMDEKDEEFVKLVSELGDEEPWWTSAYLNSGLLDSSYLGIPLHLWHMYLPLIKYKYQRGGNYFPKFRKTEVIREAFSLLIPEVYTLDIPDLLEVRNSSEFSSFRREVDRVYKQALEAPQDLPDIKSLSKYLNSEYITKLNQLALERRPRPGTVLFKNIVSLVHPVVGLLVGGKEVYDEYRDKYKTWRFAVSTLEMRGRLQAFVKKGK